MNNKKLVTALRELRRKLVERHEDADLDLKDAIECVVVLARVVEGKGIAKSFGAPGDWGYGTPIGDALAARPDAERTDEPPHYGGVLGADNQVHSDADPGL